MHAAAAGSTVATARLAILYPLAGIAAGDSYLAAVLEAIRRLVGATPAIRILVVPYELRALALEKEPRLIAVAYERRSITADREDRLVVVRPETRTIAA